MLVSQCKAEIPQKELTLPTAPSPVTTHWRRDNQPYCTVNPALTDLQRLCRRRGSHDGDEQTWSAAQELFLVS